MAYIKSKRARELGMHTGLYEMEAGSRWVYNDEYSNLDGKKQIRVDTENKNGIQNKKRSP